MKTIKFIPVLLLLLFCSCKSSINIHSDFEKGVDFSQYKTYSFLKYTNDRVQTSSLDKKKILKAIETELDQKGMAKSEKSDLLVVISTRERKINISDGSGNHRWYWGNFPYSGSSYEYTPYYSGPTYFVSTEKEGTLFIYFLDTKKKKLVWQGKGVGYLPHSRPKKAAFINEIVAKILTQYPPVLKK